jgi:rod shape-determining protein MreD
MERMAGLMSSRIFSAIVPVFTGLLFVFIGNFPAGSLLPSPLLVLMPLYFWALVRPDLMSPFWAFVLGVLEDLLSGGPPGVWALSFLAVYFMIERQRDVLAGLAGIGALMGFAAAALIACGSASAIVTIYYWHLQPIAPVLAVLAMTVLVYIPMVFVLGFVHRRLVGALRSDI